MKFACLKNNIVKQIVDATEEESNSLAGQWEMLIDITDLPIQPQVGWFLEGNKLVTNGNNGPIKITKLAMRQRFSFSELCAIEEASLTNMAVRALKSNLSVAEFIDLTRADTIGGLGLLASFGLITNERMTAILSAAPQAHELYKG